jgi:peptidoglycan/LPS O-acetylase OafA/YrhL
MPAGITAGHRTVRRRSHFLTVATYELAASDRPLSAVIASTTGGSAPAQRAPALHIPSLDGLRALSFFLVFAAHAGLSHVVPGGFGVTVFFFLSGFLITTLMRVEHRTTGTVSVRHFYIRRALRILPPFYLILALACLLTLARALPGELQPRVVLAQALHVSNYWFIWFGSDGAPVGTVPYWSLAVEEHFYLVFPVLYLALNRYLSRSAQAKTFWGLCAVVCAWRCLLVLVLGVPEDRTYLSTDTRFDSVLFGCALAMGMNPVLDRPVGRDWMWKWVLVPASLALLVFTFAYRAPWFRETIRYSLQGIALTPVFVATIRFPKWLPFRVLNNKAVAFVGVLSFTLYLAHQVVLMGLHFWLPSLRPLPASGVALVTAFVLSLAIHRFVEKPCADIRKRLARNAAVARTAVAIR